MEKFDRIPMKRVRASELEKYKGHRSYVFLKRKKISGKIIHINPGLLYVYVYLLNDRGTATCGRYRPWQSVKVSVETTR